jgi:hypothetical protein
MDNKNKYFIYGVLIVVLIVILVVLVAHKKTAQAPGTATSSTSSQASIPLPPVPQLTATQSVSGQLPANFPAKLPIETGAQVLQNETILNSITGKHDAQYIYVTTQSISQNLAAYQKYLTANKWKVTSTVDQPEFQAINASEASTTLSIILDYKSAAPQDQVSLSYIY